MTNLGRCVSRFFQNNGQIHITTTTIRKMQHTYAHEAVLTNSLSGEMEEALMKTQGHSRETTREFYILGDMKKAAEGAIEAHEILFGQMRVPNIPRPIPLHEQEYNPSEDGEDYEPQKKRRRTTWSEIEEIWIINWIKEYVRGPSFDHRINWKKMEKDLIERNPPLFLPEHRDATLLRECAKRVAKRKKLQVHQLE